MPIASNQLIGRGEFIALMAMMFATIAFSIDAMLPAIPRIATEIGDGDPAHAAWVLTSFVGGMGLGTLFSGPLSDAYGRKNIIYAGSFVYILSAAAAWASSSIEWMLMARFIQGIGASGPRVVSMAIIRDLFSGREMARITSFAMTIFMLVPAIAPAMGAAIIQLSNWRGIFVAFMAFSIICTLWAGLRLNEPLPPQKRRPIKWHLLFAAIKEMLSHKIVRLSIIMQTVMLTMLFSTLTMVQPIYERVYDRSESFPYWFGAIALISGMSSLLNAAIVTRFGMSRVITWAILWHTGIGIITLILLNVIPGKGFYLFIFWQLSLFCQGGLTMGNLNAIAMEPMGHIAGMAASIMGAISTAIAALIASPLGLFLNDTALPLIVIILLLNIASIYFMKRINTQEKITGARS